MPRKLQETRGFTLIELLISAAIITIIAGIVLVRFTSFDSTVLLKSRAYDLALAIREAQVYSLSAIKASQSSSFDFKYPYGIYLETSTGGDPTRYIFYVYKNANPLADPTAYPRYDTTDGVDEEVINTFKFGGSTQVTSMCVEVDGGSCNPVTKLNISFRRPEYAALIYAYNGASVINTANTNITKARITLKSAQDLTQGWIVEVTYLGQVVVKIAP